MRLGAAMVGAALAWIPIAPIGAVAPDSPSASRPAAIDTEAVAQSYIAGYPLVVSMRTMQRLGGLIGINELFWQQALSGPETRIIVAPNRDTLYSVAVLDLRAEPLVLTLPEVTDRYFTYQFLDAWTESFAYLGTRATGGRAGRWLIAPPGWDGDVPDDTEVIEASTPLVFLLGRYLVADEADVANVMAISRNVRLEPLSAVVGSPAPPAPPPLGEPPGTPQGIPTRATFFDELGDALALNPVPDGVQRELFDHVAQFDIGPGRHPSADSDVSALLDRGAAAGFAEITGLASLAEPVNGWVVNLGIGRYGDDILRRAVVARVGWGANVSEEAVYPIATTDASGAPLDGSNTYRITFPPAALPPVDAFWSLTVYGTDMFFVEHPSGRYTFGDRTPGLALGADGSLEIVLSHEPPADSAANWLPVPQSGFVLMLRLYLPQAPVLDGSYDYPAIELVT